MIETTYEWEEAIADFEQFLIFEKGSAAHTRTAYLSDIQKLADYVSLDPTQKYLPAELEQQDISAFVEALFDLGIAVSTQARIISGIRAFFQFMIYDDRRLNDPTELISMPKPALKLPDTLSIHEIETILATIDLSTDHGTRNRAILETLYACGLRVSELTNLEVGQIHEKEGYIHVIGKRNKERIVPIGAMALKHIQYYRQGVRRHQTPKNGEEDILFLNKRGGKLSRVMIFYILKDAVAKAQIDKNVSPHTFRHSFASHLVEGGANLKVVQDLLGHSSITTTEIYTHLDMSLLRETVQQFHPRSKV